MITLHECPRRGFWHTVSAWQMFYKKSTSHCTKKKKGHNKHQFFFSLPSQTYTLCRGNRVHINQGDNKRWKSEIGTMHRWRCQKNRKTASVHFSSVAQSCPTLCNPMHTRPPCPSPTPGVHPNSCPSSRWCHPAISSSVVPFSSCPQSLPASGSFPMSQLFTWGGQSTGVSALASVLPKKSQGWSPLGWTGC